MPAASPPTARRRVANAETGGDFSEVKGQQGLRRAVEVAVAGAHNILMLGPPGAGKSMVAKRIPTIMPEPSLNEFLEVSISTPPPVARSPTGFLSSAGRLGRRINTISDVGLIGGGAIPVQARYPSPTTASFFWTNCPNSNARRSK